MAAEPTGMVDEGLRLARLPHGGGLANVRLQDPPHPETGLDWGNQGSGTLNLAFAALVSFGLTRPEAMWLHREFAVALLAGVDPRGAEIPARTIRQWIQAHRCRHPLVEIAGGRLACTTCGMDRTVAELPPEARQGELQLARGEMAREAARLGHVITRISYDIPGRVVAGGCGSCDDTVFAGYRDGRAQVLAPDAFPCGDPLTPAGQRRVAPATIVTSNPPADEVRGFIRKALEGKVEARP